MLPDYIGADARRVERIIRIEVERNEELSKLLEEWKQEALRLQKQVNQLEAELKRSHDEIDRLTGYTSGCIDESYTGD